MMVAWEEQTRHLAEPDAEGNPRYWRVLLSDQLAAHLHMPTLSYLSERKVLTVLLPPGTTYVNTACISLLFLKLYVSARSHVIQPLDRLILGLLKRFTRQNIYNNFLSDPYQSEKPISLEVVLEAIADAWPRATQVKYCHKSFAGLVPPDASVLLDLAPPHVKLAEQRCAAAAAAVSTASADVDGGAGAATHMPEHERVLQTFDLNGPQVEEALLALSKAVHLTQTSDIDNVSRAAHTIVSCVPHVVSHSQPQSQRVSVVSIPTGVSFTPQALIAIRDRKRAAQREAEEEKAAKLAAREVRKREAEEEKAAKLAAREERKEGRAKAEADKAARKTERDQSAAAAAATSNVTAATVSTAATAAASAAVKSKSKGKGKGKEKAKRKATVAANDEEELTQLEKLRKRVCLVCVAVHMLTCCVASQSRDRRAAQLVVA